jgi:hypothetical protein
MIENSQTHDHRRCLMLSEQGIFSELKKHSRLKHLSLHLNEHYDSEKLEVPEFRVNTKDFRNLSSFELHRIYGKGPLVADDIAQCLIGSPNLKVLALGLASDIWFDTIPETIVLDSYENILKDLCHIYKDRYSGSPLALHTLRLGYGVVPLETPDGNDQRYLNKLVETRGLHVLQIFNGLATSDDGPESSDDDSDDYSAEDMHHLPMKVNFELFEDCEALRSVSLTRLHEEGRIWLNDRRRSTIQELTIEGFSGAYPNVNELAGNLSLPHLSKLNVYENLGVCSEEPEFDPLPWHNVLELDLFKDSMINKLEDKGSQLTSLTLSIDLRLHWVFGSLLLYSWLTLIIIGGAICSASRPHITN